MFSDASHESTDRERPPAEPGSPLRDEPASEMLVLTREECLALLASNSFGRLAVAMDSPVIRPVN